MGFFANMRKSKKTTFGTIQSKKSFGSFGRKKHVDLQKQDIEKVVKSATSKKLSKPDPILNQKVVSTIRSGYYLAETTSKNVAMALTERMHAKNHTKVWLAVCLTCKVLLDCKEVLAPVKFELLLEIATIAARPVKSDVVNHGAAFMARMEAFNTLREFGAEGKDAMTQIAGAGAAQLIGDQDANDYSRAYAESQYYG